MQAPALPLLQFWPGLTPYQEAVERMEAKVEAKKETIIFCEHEAVLTVGSSGKREDIGDVGKIPVIETGRGGQVTYHGPGQRVVYLVVNLERFGKDVRVYVRWLQEWLTKSLQEFNINAYISDDIGVWVDGPIGPEKIAAVGVRVRHGMAFHGISLNVNNDLGIYKHFVPCGITTKGVTRVMDHVPASMAAVDEVLKAILAARWPK